MFVLMLLKIKNLDDFMLNMLCIHESLTICVICAYYLNNFYVYRHFNCS